MGLGFIDVEVDGSLMGIDVIVCLTGIGMFSSMGRIEISEN
jgi:hypothetical protein